MAENISLFTIQSGQTINMWVQDGPFYTQGGFSCNFYLSTANDSYINSISGASVWCLTGSSNPNTWVLSIPQKYEVTTGVAHAKLRWIYEDIGQDTYYTHFYITGGEYWSEYQKL